MVIVIILIVLLVLAGLYVLSTMGRRNHPGIGDLRGWAYAHRGLHDKSRPENSMSAFRAALKSGYGIELDVHLLADGNLAVMHDSALKRTTGAEGKIEDLTTEQLKEHFLEGTFETIPTFREVLELFDGKAPLIVELKCTDGNHAKLAAAVCDMLEDYKGVYCLESFDPRCVRWLRKNRPHIIRGQLAENFLPVKSSVPWILRFAMTHQMLNFLLMPDFVAYRYSDRLTVSNVLARKIWGLQGVSWTLQNMQEYENAIEEDWLPIFENFTP